MKNQPISLKTVVEVYWHGEWPPLEMLHVEHRPCALCGRDLRHTATVPPESLHPCCCGGWHHVHNACVDDGDLVPRVSSLCRSYGQLVVCPEALRVAEELMGDWLIGNSFASLYYPWAVAGGSDA